MHGIHYTTHSSNDQFNCPDASINDTCIIYCDKQRSMRSFDCGNAGECYFYCHANQCADGGTLNATNSNNLYVYSSNDQCLFENQVFVPNEGNAYIGIDNMHQKELKKMKIYSGSNTKSININCTGSTTESCKQIEVYAENSQYLEIVGYNQAILEDATINCPRNSSYNGPELAPCIIDFTHGGILKKGTFNTLNGIPTDIILHASTMNDIITIECTAGTSTNNKLSFQNEGDCWITKSPTIDPTIEPTPSPTINPTQSPTDNPIFTLITEIPTPSPTDNPSLSPTPRPSQLPTPTVNLTPSPTGNPIFVLIAGIPTPSPTDNPSLSPTSRPSKLPTTEPSVTIVTNVVDIKENKSSSSNSIDLDDSALFQLYIVAVICCFNCALCCCFAIWCYFRSKQNEIHHAMPSKQLSVHSTEWNNNYSLNSIEMKPIESTSPQPFFPNAVMVHSNRQIYNRSHLNGEEKYNDNDTKQEESESSTYDTSMSHSNIESDVILKDKCNINGSNAKREGVNSSNNVFYDYMVNSPDPNYMANDMNINNMNNNMWIPQHVVSTQTYNQHYTQHSTMTDITLQTMPMDDK